MTRGWRKNCSNEWNGLTNLSSLPCCRFPIFSGHNYCILCRNCIRLQGLVERDSFHSYVLPSREASRLEMDRAKMWWRCWHKVRPMPANKVYPFLSSFLVPWELMYRNSMCIASVSTTLIVWGTSDAIVSSAFRSCSDSNLHVSVLALWEKLAVCS